MERNSYEYELFCEHMQRYESGERSLNEQEQEQVAFLASTGEAFKPLPFDTFLENMRRYEAGERELNEEEKDFQEYLASTGEAFHPLVFDTFLENMKIYQENKTSGRHR
jgi:hypothetical protein